MAQPAPLRAVAGPRPGDGAALVGDSTAMAAVRRLIDAVAGTMASVLLTGPSGSGKELVARAIHRQSPRAAQPFVPLNMAAIPRELIEAELFGHEKGAFTGASGQLRGRFEEASGGTLFLDEIGDMPADMQVKLLRVLEDRAIPRVGGRTPVPIDTRIIAATHRDLPVEIARGNFREDLFYRLAVFPIAIPPLAERAADIPMLVDHFLQQGGGRSGRAIFTPCALERLAAHGWPGNVRELRNFVERVTILHGEGAITGDAVDPLLPPRQPLLDESDALWTMSSPAAASSTQAQTAPSLPVDLRRLVADLEHSHIVEALRQSRGMVADAARMLSLQRTTLIEKMNKYGISKRPG